MADELDGFEQLFHQYLLDRKASASTVTWNKIESLPEAAVSGGGGRREGLLEGACKSSVLLCVTRLAAPLVSIRFSVFSLKATGVDSIVRSALSEVTCGCVLSVRCTELQGQLVCVKCLVSG